MINNNIFNVFIYMFAKCMEFGAQMYGIWGKNVWNLGQKKQKCMEFGAQYTYFKSFNPI